MKGLIIFATHYGSTQQYAKWIQDETGYSAIGYKEVTDQDLMDADRIIIGSWVLANKLVISKWLETKKELLKSKSLYFYSVSGAKPGDECLKKVFSDSMSEDMLKNAKCYQFGGRRETKKMSKFHKFMMWIAVTFIEKNPDKKSEMKQYVDRVDKKYIVPLLMDIK